ncbi:MAG: TFIIB-type zinc finger domain-containing protein [Candidatus Lokiarchaeota archaeon]|nr:TFIIB-type zinc finger domain-containing protein [Candidatus Harpocratesius repetitus]
MFTLSTRTSWQKEQTRLDLTDMKEFLYPYPLIERKFFDDLMKLCRSQATYYVEMGLISVFNNKKQQLNPDTWILIWALDFKDRVYQILIDRNVKHKGRGAIAAVGPQDLGEFFARMKQNAILPLLTLINTPEKMKSVGVIVSRPKSYRDKQKERQEFQAFARFQKWIAQLKATPNKEGQWFPSSAPKCPVCGNPLVGISDNYRIGFGYLICPECGHSERRRIGM